MANFRVDFEGDLEKQLERLARSANTASIEKILGAGGEVLKETMKKQCSAHKESGSMTASIRVTKSMKNDKGYFVVVRPTGTEVREMKNGNVHKVRNAEKLAYLHYGTSKQAATGIVTKVVNQASSRALDEMQKAYNREVQIDG